MMLLKCSQRWYIHRDKGKTKHVFLRSPATVPGGSFWGCDGMNTKGGSLGRVLVLFDGTTLSLILAHIDDSDITLKPFRSKKDDATPLEEVNPLLFQPPFLSHSFSILSLIHPLIMCLSICPLMLSSIHLSIIHPSFHSHSFFSFLDKPICQGWGASSCPESQAPGCSGSPGLLASSRFRPPPWAFATVFTRPGVWHGAPGLTVIGAALRGRRVGLLALISGQTSRTTPETRPGGRLCWLQGWCRTARVLS